MTNGSVLQENILSLINERPVKHCIVFYTGLWKACETLDNGFEEAFQYTVIGNGHNRLKSTNLLERLNQEVRRREKIIRIFPNRTSANRLIGAVLMELHDEWLSSTRKYIKFDQ
uniref:transposase n=1 Tax=Ligilactobacillus murinus TaxID=1622 RepID=UPI00385746D9